MKIYSRSESFQGCQSTRKRGQSCLQRTPAAEEDVSTGLSVIKTFVSLSTGPRVKVNQRICFPLNAGGFLLSPPPLHPRKLALTTEAWLGTEICRHFAENVYVNLPRFMDQHFNGDDISFKISNVKLTSMTFAI
jgi:hypothetical protein